MRAVASSSYQMTNESPLSSLPAKAKSHLGRPRPMEPLKGLAWIHVASGPCESLTVDAVRQNDAFLSQGHPRINMLAPRSSRQQATLRLRDFCATGVSIPMENPPPIPMGALQRAAYRQDHEADVPSEIRNSRSVWLPKQGESLAVAQRC